MKYKIKDIFPMILIILSVSAHGGEMVSFPSRNQSPFVRIFGLPAAQSSSVVSRHFLSIQTAGIIANNHSWALDGNTGIYLDGETQLVLMNFRYGLSRNFEIGTQISYVHHGKGVTDQFIYDFHQTFHLPQGRRGSSALNEFRYVYMQDSVHKTILDKAVGGMGDVQLFAGKQIVTAENIPGLSVSIRGGVKLPTGNPVRFTGSGSADIWGQVLGQYQLNVFGLPFFLSSSGGGLLLGDYSQLSDIQKHVVAFGSAGAAIQPWDWLSLQSQIDWHSPFYRSGFDQLGLFSAQIIFGGSIHLKRRVTITAGVSEDLAISTATDVAFYLSFNQLFGTE